MLAELSELHPCVKAAFEEASAGAGADLWALSQAGPEEMLNRTEYTQPALLAAGVLWRRGRRRVGARRGAAIARRIHCAGCRCAPRWTGALVRIRGQLMQTQRLPVSVRWPPTRPRMHWSEVCAAVRARSGGAGEL
jgi:[acyl-carrier-protein] S-malonyltransferase